MTSFGDRRVAEASLRRNVRDIGCPLHVRARGCEVTLDQIGRLPVAIADGRDGEPAATDPLTPAWRIRRATLCRYGYPWPIARHGCGALHPCLSTPYGS